MNLKLRHWPEKSKYWHTIPELKYNVHGKWSKKITFKDEASLDCVLAVF